MARLRQTAEGKWVPVADEALLHLMELFAISAQISMECGIDEPHAIEISWVVAHAKHVADNSEFNRWNTSASREDICITAH